MRLVKATYMCHAVRALASFIGVFLLLSAPVVAQQQTRQVIPQTRNPQTSPVELFQQQEDVQSTGSQQLLNQRQTKIDIPAGKPAQASDTTTAHDRRNGWPIISVIGILAAIIFIAWSRLPKAVSEPGALDQTVEPSKHKLSSAASSSKKKNTKKKSGQRKKRK